MYEYQEVLDQWIREVELARTARAMSKRELAEKSGISQSNLSQILSGKRNVTLETVVKISMALGCWPRFQFWKNEEIDDERPYPHDYTLGNVNIHSESAAHLQAMSFFAHLFHLDYKNWKDEAGQPRVSVSINDMIRALVLFAYQLNYSMNSFAAWMDDLCVSHDFGYPREHVEKFAEIVQLFHKIVQIPFLNTPRIVGKMQRINYLFRRIHAQIILQHILIRELKETSYERQVRARYGC